VSSLHDNWQNVERTGKLQVGEETAMIRLILGLVTAATSLAGNSPTGDRPRLTVLTDINSLTAGVAEPDDGQSLIRLMLYTNEFDIEGLIATSNLGQGRTTRPELIRQVVDAYGRVAEVVVVRRITPTSQ